MGKTATNFDKRSNGRGDQTYAIPALAVGDRVRCVLPGGHEHAFGVVCDTSQPRVGVELQEGGERKYFARQQVCYEPPADELETLKARVLLSRNDPGLRRALRLPHTKSLAATAPAASEWEE